MPCFFEGENSVSRHRHPFLVPPLPRPRVVPRQRYIFVERQFHALPRIAPFAFHQRQVLFFYYPRPYLPVQFNKCRAAFGEEQNSGSFPVKAMNQLQEFPFRMLSTQLLYDAQAHAAAAMNRDPGRFVDYQKRLILKQYFKPDESDFG